MKPEKMTDEQLQAMRDVAEHDETEQWRSPAILRLLAHIAALTAERDDLRKEMADECRTHMRTQDDARILREWVQTREGHITELHAMWREAESRLAAIRERVKALEAERDAYRRDFEAELAGAKSLRVKHGARADETFMEFIARLASDSSDLATIRKRAKKVMSTSAPLVPVLRFVLGDDIERQPPQTDDLAALEQYRENEEAKAEPSTAEAFATVRTLVTGVPRGTEVSSMGGERILSLLERRMGAMERAARALLWLHKQGLAGNHDDAGWDALRSVLTDAPPVFTLEEVKEALEDASTVDGVMSRLTALRR